MSLHPSTPPTAAPPPPALRRWLMVASMLAAIAAVTAIAWWDQQREAAAALRDLGAEQALVAASLAESLRARLETAERDAALLGECGASADSGRYLPARVRRREEAPEASADRGRVLLGVPVRDGRVVDLGMRVSDLLGRDPRAEGAGELAFLLRAPGEVALRALDGRSVASPPLESALEGPQRTVRLGRSEAADLGLWERTALAGIATVDTPRLGRWGVVVVATAARERDRGTRALFRLALSVGLASGLVLAFGGLALRTQRKELELGRELAVAEVARARDDELQRAGRLATMGTFAMGIAHEISTPLGVIVGRTEQIGARLKDDERGARAATVILQQADHIRQIIRRFLDLARGQAPALGRADPSDIVRSAVTSTEHRFVKAEVTLTTDVPRGMPEIQCDRDLLQHALVNLLLNACEACPPGGHVQVTARAVADRVAFVVTDDGAGISPEHAARVAEPFFTTKTGRGSGLGLAIATEIVKSHRGELTIAGAGDKGTRACIEIPVAGPAEASHDGG